MALDFRKKLEEKVTKVNPSFKKSADLQAVIEAMSIAWKETLEMYKASLEELVNKHAIDIEEYVLEIERVKQIKRGDQGEEGEPGKDGADGKDGKDGVDGKDGKDGEKGENGANGKDGVNGKDGADGKDGKDGSPYTAQDIATKLNTLENAIGMNVITGLNEMFANMQRAFNQRERGGGGGGGMGNAVTQTTALTSGTTTVTLASNVASNGKAIWFNYQGQQQAYGTHFTVSGKTITLLFTPDDNTYADIIYIRT